METHAGDKTPGTGNEFSTLDWPSPEVLRAARRARAHAVRDMTVDLCRRLRRLVLRSPDADSVPSVTRETLARAGLDN
jgi:hypothetical protein